MADHHYFTRSKAPKDPSRDQDQWERKMTGHNNDASLTEITATDTTITQQNELIAQMMQQIVDLRTVIKRAQELANLPITANLIGPDDRKPPFHFPSPNQPTP